METVQVSLGARSYDISVAQDLFSSGAATGLLAPFVKSVKVLIVSDSNVFPLYGELLARTILAAGASGVSESVFPAGETSKHLATIGDICRDAAPGRISAFGCFSAKSLTLDSSPPLPKVQKGTTFFPLKSA